MQQSDKSNEQRPFVPKTALDMQKMKLDKLMANPEKPVIIPDSPRDKKGFLVPEFVRNVMGSSAGAGSGEFHVYRHLRRKEYTRQKINQKRAEEDKLDDEFQQKLEDNERIANERTAKKRAKRLKLKAKKKLKAKAGPAPKKVEEFENTSESEEDSDVEKEPNGENTEKESLSEDDDCKDTVLPKPKGDDCKDTVLPKDDNCT